MLSSITITLEDVLTQIKLSCKLPEIFDQIVTRKFITAAVTESGIKVETEELQKAADQLRLMNGLNSADDTWAWLEKNGLSLDDFEEIIYTNVISSKLATHLFADKVEPYFFANQLDYTGVIMYEVVLEDEDLALELFYAIKEGETSFYNVANQYIKDTELRRKCGYLGLVHRRDLKPEISAAVFANTPPQLLKPVVTSQGAHLILVEEIIQPTLNNRLQMQIMADLFAEYIKQNIEGIEVINKLNK
uniref:peptidylprolyl isomerase n=1 Tax=Nostoc sp. PCC 9448 TaxID=2099384 RepID=A0A2P0ZGI8_9NOSO|nr:PpiC-type peptidyl-prolyl cis-transl isomerase [Nostoc sp. PCC 9448]